MKTEVDQAHHQTLSKLAVMMGLAIPTTYDMICEETTLAKKGFRQSKDEKSTKKQEINHKLARILHLLEEIAENTRQDDTVVI